MSNINELYKRINYNEYTKNIEHLNLLKKI